MCLSNTIGNAEYNSNFIKTLCFNLSTRSREKTVVNVDLEAMYVYI